MRHKDSFQIGRDRERLTFDGDYTVGSVRRVFAVVHDVVHKRGFSEVQFDFTNCASAFSAAMLPLCAHAAFLRSKGVSTSVQLPSRDRLSRLFINAAWAHHLDPRQYDPPKRHANNAQFPCVAYFNHEQQNELLNELLEKLLSAIPRFSRTAFAAVEWALNEITDNVINHSQSEVGGFLQLSVFEASKSRVEFTVADAGDGVPRTLRTSKPEIETDVDALMEAVKSGVTRNASQFQGNGLYGTLEICRVGGGRFSLNAGNAALICNGSGVHARREVIPFTGTTVDALIDFSDPQLLEKALTIDGVQHKPTDYIELRYEQDDLRSIHFRIAEQAPSVRSRLAGKPVRTKLGNLIAGCAGQSLLVDFEGISVVSSSFADEVFGKLFAELGPMRFMQSVRLVNVTPTVQALIDRAITQRMQAPAVKLADFDKP